MIEVEFDKLTSQKRVRPRVEDVGGGESHELARARRTSRLEAGRVGRRFPAADGITNGSGRVLSTTETIVRVDMISRERASSFASG